MKIKQIYNPNHNTLTIKLLLDNGEYYGVAFVENNNIYKDGFDIDKVIELLKFTHNKAPYF